MTIHRPWKKDDGLRGEDKRQAESGDEKKGTLEGLKRESKVPLDKNQSRGEKASHTPRRRGEDAGSKRSRRQA